METDVNFFKMVEFLRRLKWELVLSYLWEQKRTLTMDISTTNPSDEETQELKAVAELSKEIAAEKKRKTKKAIIKTNW